MRLSLANFVLLFALLTMAVASPIEPLDPDLANRESGHSERSVLAKRDADITLSIIYGSAIGENLILTVPLIWNPHGFYDGAGDFGSGKATFSGHGVMGGHAFSEFTFSNPYIGYTVTVLFFHTGSGSIIRCATVLGTIQGIKVTESTLHTCTVNGKNVMP
ncbi:uncharacterized protein L969DRAFT_87662 [Mixia osmundae IAM 14324]|uniref:Uncharacterized protein n=1 Tax=Mixia osmundae (strain CBS 9802 / IAM 14324 / JCM 22182 / KY 12970) TaxID=764103 RepID=G7E421_MIXOS|nr:uncharacterized protein L969DRAFT_87662 [Mixia osmundae IAM 14324]KEI39674.1 hypothetical protein L969DRAFT_87662 [Mixia osmundae IAM 14324]GAA97581.1 hypothetical protein E5Q_04259 [Mixia osmundae IAM 14324]